MRQLDGSDQWTYNEKVAEHCSGLDPAHRSPVKNETDIVNRTRQYELVIPLLDSGDQMKKKR